MKTNKEHIPLEVAKQFNISLSEVVKLWKMYEESLEKKFEDKWQRHLEVCDEIKMNHDKRMKDYKAKYDTITSQISSIEKERKKSFFKARYDEKLSRLRAEQFACFATRPRYPFHWDLRPSKEKPTIEGFLSYLANKEDDED